MNPTLILAVFLLAAPDDAAWKASCERVKDARIPATDRPDVETAELLRGCDSEALWYGIGGAPDPVKARQCAILELGEEEIAFEGAAILMQAYASGKGAARNIDLAIKFACDVGWAPAENESRIAELEKMKTLGARARTDFDLCDHTTSGYMAGLCAARDARIEAAKRSAKASVLMAGWSAADREAFATLRKAADAWIAARSEEEVDLSGTARGAFVVAEAEAREEAFAALLQKLEKSPASMKGGKAELEQADKALNATYERVMGTSDFSYGTVKKDGIKTAERAWIAYRDAWLAFSKKKYPGVSADALNAELTREREAMLREFLPQPE